MNEEADSSSSFYAQSLSDFTIAKRGTEYLLTIGTAFKVTSTLPEATDSRLAHFIFNSEFSRHRESTDFYQ